MKQLIKFAAFFLISMIGLASCKKETVVAPPVLPPVTTNKPPIAKAGTDQGITLPINTVTIDGSGSNDPDGSIVSYSWAQIAGPNQSVIITPSQASSVVNNLIQGIYQFEIKITDDSGLSAKDTVQISVNSLGLECNINLSSIGSLSVTRYPRTIATAAAGNKILFAGGNISGTDQTTRVDIYDKVSQTWSTAELSQARMDISVGVAGSKIFFAGGYSNNTYESSRVDIYDAATNKWSTAELTVARMGIGIAAIGNKVFFAGGSEGYGNDYDIVDIYDISTNLWSTAYLSETKYICSAISLNNKIYFTGPSKNVDVYDGTSNSWSVITLSEPRINMASIAAGNTIFWAGGITDDNNGKTVYLDKVEMYDVSTGNRTFHQLSQGRAFFKAVMKNSKILFYTGSTETGQGFDKVDIYNINTQEWSACTMPQSLNYSTIISTGDKVYVTGGVSSNQVFELEY